MTDQQKQGKPPQVTYACLVVMLGSVFVVLLMWDRIAGLQTLETRQALQTFLDGSGMKDAGLSVTGLTTTVKVVSMVSAACATAMVILGWQASQRSQSARLALTVLAVPLFLSGLVSDGFLSSGAALFWSSGVAAGVLTLWLGPTRQWFAETPGPARAATSPAAGPSRPEVRTPAPAPSPWSPPAQQAPQAEQAPPTRQSPEQTPQQQSAQPPPQQAPWPPAWAPPTTTAYDVHRPGRAVAARPRAVTWACVLTWACTALAAAGLVLSMALLAGDSATVLHQMYRQNPTLAERGFSDQALLTMIWVMTGVALAVCLAAATFAVLVFLRRRWAWYALLASAAAAALVFLVGALGSPVAYLFLGASVATLGCLVRPEARAWLQGR